MVFRKITVFILILTTLFSIYLFIKNLKKKKEISEEIISSGISIGSSTIANLESMFQYMNLKGKPENIILLLPYESDKLGSKISFISLFPEENNSKSLEIDIQLLKELKKRFSFYYIISSELNKRISFIRKHFPDSRFLPIFIPPLISERKVSSLVKEISLKCSPQTMVIGVANFSEKFPLNANRFWNLKLLRTILNFERIYFKDLRVNCWQCIYGARLFAKLRRNEMAKVYNLKGFSKGVDSSLNLIFEKGTPVEQDVRKVNTILFTGDIMLDRGVKNLIKKKGLYYPFEKLSSFFNGVDFVVGNLEGTIQENASESRKSMKFSFAPEVVEALSNNNFRLISLANNHSFDFGKTGLEKTMVFLKNAKIDFIGNPLKIDKDSLIEIEKISFLALNKTYNFKSPDDEIAELIKKIKFSDKNKFLVVFIHWGEEYQTKSSPTQRELAHKIIDAGADLIIGSHPHVVQEIEIFNKKLIFYSLGNFIFDQYFSEETQKGLIVGLEKYPEKIRYWLFPLKSVKSQPFLMEREEADKYLEELALKSTKDLLDEIKKGIIEGNGGR